MQAPGTLVVCHLDALSLIKALAVELGCDHIVFDVHTPARDTLVDASAAVFRGHWRNSDPFPGVWLEVAGRLEAVGGNKGTIQQREA